MMGINHKYGVNNTIEDEGNHAILTTLILNNSSACNFKKIKNGLNIINRGFKTLNKNIIFKDSYWSITCSHDGYLNNYGIIHERTLEFYPEINKIVG